MSEEMAVGGATSESVELPAPPAKQGRMNAGPPMSAPAGAVPTLGVRPQDCSCGGGAGGTCTCGATAAQAAIGFVYAIGTVTARFPNQSVEREFIQVWGRTNYSGPVSNKAMFEVLSQGQNIYLARSMCWIFQNESVDMYVLQPRSYVELTDFILALDDPIDKVTLDMIIGVRGGIAPPTMCNGTQLSIVVCDQVFTFTTEAFIQSIIDYAASLGRIVTRAAAYNAFSILVKLTDNSGESDEHRAINYVTFKSLDIYVLETQLEADNFQLTSVTATPSSLSGARKIVNVIFTYTNTRSTEVQQYFTRVDVTGEFPFLVTGISRFYNMP
ncbi:MAG: hypothetical protein ACJ754_14760 [Pyrinomonadaceae bacterium]